MFWPKIAMSPPITTSQTKNPSKNSKQWPEPLWIILYHFKFYVFCLYPSQTHNAQLITHPTYYALKSEVWSLQNHPWRTCAFRRTQKGWGEKSLYSNYQQNKRCIHDQVQKHDEISVSMHILTFSCSKQYEYLLNFHHDFVKYYSLDRGQNALHNYGTQQGDNSFGAEKQRTHTTVLPL